MVPLALVLFFLAGVSANYVGGYLMLSRSRNGQPVGTAELQALADSAATLPVTRIWVAFAWPTMTYVPGSNTLQYTGMGLSTTGDYGFADLKSAIGKLTASGIQVYVSMGGWNYNCFPYLYARYSVGGYGTSTPNYWEITKYGGGDVNNCVQSNMWCYVCEPPTENTTLADFSIFPEPNGSSTWQQAAAFVQAGAKGGPVQWNTDMVPGSQWTDSKTGITVTVPGNTHYLSQNRDPYQDLVYLAKDLGASGVDLDYEEMWHADYYKTGSGPWNLTQTVYKYAAIAQDIIINIQNIQPSLLFSTAAGAAGAWAGNWWGGNLKGVWLYTQQWYPSVIAFMTKSQGVNVMTYDLSDNEQYSECPTTDCCTLHCQVDFYMSTFAQAGISANVGYEVGTPAYPNPTEDPTHQLPLTTSELQMITSSTQTKYPGGFMWELYKDSDGYATPTQVAQSVCNVVLPGNSRCKGTIPVVN